MKKDHKYPLSIKGSKSLLAKYLTPETFELLKNKSTKNGFTFFNLANSGIKNFDSGIGVYAGDEETYEEFSPLLDNVINDYHGNCQHINSSIQPLSDQENLNCDPEKKFVLSTRIRIARNLKNISFGAHISNEQRNFVETSVSDILKKFTGNLAGSYFSLNNLTELERKELVADHFLFKAGDRFLDAAGLNRDWPNGRGIFYNKEKTFLVWINEEDHLRIISMQPGGNITEIFNRLALATKKIEEHIQFAQTEKLGFLSSCPTNLGTSMRASVHIKLPNLGENKKILEQITEKYHLQIRGVHGEHSESQDGVFDISNRRRLGISELDCIHDLNNGVIALIEAEKKLSA